MTRIPMLEGGCDPCPKCGGTVRYFVLDRSDRNADELPVVPVCFPCRYRFKTAAHPHPTEGT